MKNIGTIIAAVFLSLVLLAYMCTYQVRFTEHAFVKTWGKAPPASDGGSEKVGLYYKWPRPIQQVVKYDKRLRVLNDKTEETRTTDGENLILTTFTIWRINHPQEQRVVGHVLVEPVALTKTVGHVEVGGAVGVDVGEQKLRSMIRTHKQAVVGGHKLSEFVSTDAAERNLDGIEKELLDLVRADAEKEYGIFVQDFGIKKLGLPQSVTTAIFAKMKSNEEKKAERYRSEGNAAARSIEAEARAAERRILAAARQKVAEIETEAQRVIGEYYKEFNSHPELRIFLDQLRTLEDTLQTRTTIIFDQSTPPFNLFDEAVRKEVGTGESLGREASVDPLGDAAIAAKRDTKD